MRALSLEYHDVVDPADVDASGFPGQGPASYKIAHDRFAQHLAAIARRRGEAPRRVPDWLLAPKESPRPLFITFDDGGLSAYTIIADELERHGWSGHFFITAGRVGTPTFLSGPQVRELHGRGHVIGSHSYTHPARMGGCSRAQLVDEWTRSVALLSDILGEPVVTGSVPGGFYLPVVGETAADAGLAALFTSAPTTRVGCVNGCRILGRYTLRRWSTSESAAGLGAGDALPRAQQWAFYGALTLVRTLAGDHYTRMRQLFWSRR